MTNSNFFGWNLNDLLKGLIMAVLTPVVTLAYTTVQAGSLIFDWKLLGGAALVGGLAYLLKNVFPSADGVPFSK